MGFVTYRKFYEQDRAENLIQILTDHRIEFEQTEDMESLDSSLYGGNKQFSKQFFVKLKQADFARVDSILLQMNESELETVDKDHYLFGFTDEELFDILSKPDEWNEFDYQLSKKILKERGKEINTDTIDLLKKQRIKELAKPEEGQRNWIYTGYLFALLGGLLGIFIGWHLSTFKKTLPNGETVYGYSKEDRRSGKMILVLGILMFLIWLTIRIVSENIE